MTLAGQRPRCTDLRSSVASAANARRLAGSPDVPPAAHYVAAAGLFLIFVAVVWLNARDQERCRGGRASGTMLGLRTRYAAVAIAMVVLPAIVFVVGLLTGWHYVLLVVEAVLIVLFATFWVLQTAELGDRACRTRELR